MSNNFPILEEIPTTWFSVILLLRTYALYRRDYRALVFLPSIAVCLLSLSCVCPWPIWRNGLTPDLEILLSGLSQRILRQSVSAIPVIGVCHKLRAYPVINLLHTLISGISGIRRCPVSILLRCRGSLMQNRNSNRLGSDARIWCSHISHDHYEDTTG